MSWMEHVARFSFQQFSGKDYFHSAKTDKELLLLIFNDHVIRSSLCSFCILNLSEGTKKCSTISRKLRATGNTEFGKGNLMEALNFYNESISFCPWYGDKENLCLAYGNRSAVLFELHRFDECLQDISDARQHGFPKHLDFKLCKRQAEVRLIQNIKSEAIKFANQALTSAGKESSETNASKTKIWHETFMLNVDTELVLRAENHSTNELSSAVHNINDSDSLDNNINIISINGKGRGVVAKRDLFPGDHVFTEQPFASVLLPHREALNCHHCHKKISVHTPCRECCTARFCSLTCHDTAMSSYHANECRILQVLQMTGIAHLTYRTFLVALNSNCLNGMFSSCDDRYIPPDELELDKPTNCMPAYRLIHSLMTHRSETPPDDLWHYTLTSCLLFILYLCGQCNHHFNDSNSKSDLELKGSLLENLLLLKRSKEFKIDIDEMSQSTALCSAAKLLTRHTQQLICNAHAITGISCVESGKDQLVDDAEELRIATAIYPIASMLNHSCEPNTITSFCGRQLYVKVERSIGEGEEIYNCYGPHVKRMACMERQRCLKQQYHFDCLCNACRRESGVIPIAVKVKCSFCANGSVELLDNKDCSLPCKMCKTMHLPTKIKSKLDEANVLFGNGIQQMHHNELDALKELLKCYEIRKSILLPGNCDFGRVCDAVAQCYCRRREFERALPYLKESILVTQGVYGKTSIEYGNELVKLSDVLINLLTSDKIVTDYVNEAVDVVSNAINLFQLKYGENHSTLMELRSRKHLLDSLQARIMR